MREAARSLENAGYGAVWTNEVIGKDALVQLAVLLAATDRMTFGTCIANVWARPAQTMHAAAAQLAQAYPGRLALGLGVGYLEQAASVGREFGSPLATMRDYLEAMDSPTWPLAPEAPYPRIVAANGPKMLALADEKADGAFPAGLPPESTAHAREALGPDKLLVMGLSLTEDMLVAQNDSSCIAAMVCEHLTAGADHVALLLPVGGDFAAGVRQLEKLGPALAQLPITDHRVSPAGTIADTTS
nr:LLM class flavin-dependent oxidoreductase [Mycolicibacterium vulneris]